MKRTKSFYYRRAVDILQKIQFAALATVSHEGEPWNSPVWAMHDTSLNIYWFSDKESQHSLNVRQNGQVFIALYDSTYPETVPTGERSGVYIKASVYELIDPEEIRRIRRLKKGPSGDDPTPFMGAAVRRVYKAMPQQAWINDVQIDNGVFIRDYRVALSLRELRRCLRRPV